MNKRAVIGITATQDRKEGILRLWNGYPKAVSAGGGIPLIIPSVISYPYYEEYLNQMDGLLISGGQDLMPLIYGEEPLEGFTLEDEMTPERDEFELQLIRRAMERNMPILGICRGIQALAAANGGTLYQDIDSCMVRDIRIKHSQECPEWAKSHAVHIRRDTKLFQMLGLEQIEVNTLHHQAVKKVPEGFIISATAKDGVIEGMESAEHDFVVGVQWHPERLLDRYEEWVGFFRAFVERAEEYAMKRDKNEVKC